MQSLTGVARHTREGLSGSVMPAPLELFGLLVATAIVTIAIVVLASQR